MQGAPEGYYKACSAENLWEIMVFPKGQLEKPDLPNGSQACRAQPEKQAYRRSKRNKGEIVASLYT